MYANPSKCGHISVGSLHALSSGSTYEVTEGT